MRNSLVLFLFCVQIVCAQQYSFRQYTTAEGLPNNAIRVLFVDSRGLLWVGTENGLSKMENGSFRSFFESDGLAFNSCWAIGEDYLNQMWFGSYGGGLTLFDGKSFQVFNSQNGLIDDRIRQLYAYQDKMLVGTENGISIIHIEERRIESVPETQRDEGTNYTSGFFEAGERLFYTTYRHGLYEILFSESGTEVKKIHDHKPIYAIGHFDQKVYTSNKGHVDLFDVENFISAQPEPISFGQSVVWSYLKGPEETVFAASWGIYRQDGGLFVLSGSRFAPFERHLGLKAKNFISGTFDSLTKTLYLGSNDRGMYSIKLDERILFEGERNSEVKGFSGKDELGAILYSDGISLLEASKFLSSSDFKQAQTRFLRNLPFPIPNHEDDFFELDYDTHAEDVVFYQIHKIAGLYWVNTNIGIFGLAASGEFKLYLPVHTYVIGSSPEDKLISSNPYGGMRIYDDPGNFKFRYFSPKDPQTPTQLAGIVHSDSASYFVSVFSGLYDLRVDSGLRSFLHEKIWTENKFKSVHLGQDGLLYMGAEFGDLYILDLNEGFEIVDKVPKSQLIGNGIVFIETYGDAVLIGTEVGLNIYSKGTVRFFDKEQGLGAGLITSGKVIGEVLYVGYDMGYYKIQLPELLEEKEYEFTFDVNELMVNNSLYGEEKILWFSYEAEKILLKNREKTISIDFKPVGHPYPQKLRYRYRLTPEDTWSAEFSESKITLASLSYGEYQLEIETLDLHSGKRSATVLLDFSIASPVYFRWWFLLGVFLLLALVTYTAFRWRLQQVRRQAVIREKIVQTKLEALRSQMNPHFIFNAVNSIQYYILGNQGDEALDFLGKFSKLMRNTLENSVRPQVRLSREVDYLSNYVELENKRVNNKVNFKMEIPVEIDPDNLYIPSMLVQPFVENVFVHAFEPGQTDPQLIISFSVPDEGMIYCAVWDNGKGIQAKKKESIYKSRGMDLVRERLALLPGYKEESIRVISVENKGTEIIIRIPCFFK
ncbi:histidine kinase [Indibacter alkaliphilus]|uniref:histidine kinase n=1 Tax=Indibacter alkaliphilus TaxID=579922 RepID=UPI001362588C|nr:histidine kinase [Indibacter alkaliphilus]